MNQGNWIEVFVPISYYNINIVLRKVEGSETVDNWFMTTIEPYGNLILKIKHFCLYYVTFFNCYTYYTFRLKKNS